MGRKVKSLFVIKAKVGSWKEEVPSHVIRII